MWACCDDTSSDDDQQRLLAPVRGRSHRACLACWATELDELKVALGCRFALDVLTIIQQDYATADQEPLRPWARGLVLTSQPPAFSSGGRAHASLTATFVKAYVRPDPSLRLRRPRLHVLLTFFLGLSGIRPTRDRLPPNPVFQPPLGGSA